VDPVRLCRLLYSRWEWNGMEDRTTENELSGLWTSRRFLDFVNEMAPDTHV
jgi:hypothetical protein